MSTSQQPRPPTKNRILNALPIEEYDRLSPHLDPVKLTLGQILYRPYEPIEHVYFPEDAMISIVSNMAEGTGVEVGVVGQEGMLGIAVVLGTDRTPNESMVQIADGAMRVKAPVILEEFKRGGILQDILLRYVQARIIQATQSAACNRLHSVEERLARWLLMSHDRSASDELALTQEFIAMMLGVRRAGVTAAAITLQGDGFIKYRRGHVTITDRPGLEEFTCECYRIVKAEYDRLLG